MLLHCLLQFTRLHKFNKLNLWPRLTNTYTKGNATYPSMSFILAYFWTCLFVPCIKLHYMIFGDLHVIKKLFICFFCMFYCPWSNLNSTTSRSREIVIN
jgi:hypothetical protein